MLVAEAELMDDLVTTLAIAPRIADILARRPGLLEALLSVSDRKEPPMAAGSAAAHKLERDARVARQRGAKRDTEEL